MNQIYDTIIKLRSTSSRKDKIKILQLVSEDVDIKNFLYLIYNPFYKYSLNIKLSKIKHCNSFTLDIIDFMEFVLEHLYDKDISYKSYDLLQYMNKNDIQLAKMISDRSISAGVGKKILCSVFPNLIPVIPNITYSNTSFPVYVHKSIGKLISIIINKHNVVILDKYNNNISVELSILDELYEIYLHFNRDIVLLGEINNNNKIFLTDIFNYIDWRQSYTNQSLKRRISLLEDIEYSKNVQLMKFKIFYTLPKKTNNLVIRSL
jgi:hypothetical protein